MGIQTFLFNKTILHILWCVCVCVCEVVAVVKPASLYPYFTCSMHRKNYTTQDAFQDVSSVSLTGLLF